MSVPLKTVAFSPLSEMEQLEYAKRILEIESKALNEASDRLDQSFVSALHLLSNCKGRVIVTGMGKAGLIGEKISATLASTGTQAHFLHPAEAVHGDLGRIGRDDVVLALSLSGETEELVRLLPILNGMGIAVIAITSKSDSTLAHQSEITLALGPLREAGNLGLAPSTSTTVMLAVGDALALVLSKMKDFQEEDFAKFHPAGNLGKNLQSVDQVMRKNNDLRVAKETVTVRDVFSQISKPGRRTGAVILVDENGKLSGLFTDSDLARIFESRLDHVLDKPIAEVMTVDPITVPSGTRVRDAVHILKDRKFSELPVIDEEHRPVGLIDVTDCIHLFPTG